MANDTSSLEAIIPKVALAILRENTVLPRLVRTKSSREQAANGKTVRINVAKPASVYTVTPGSLETASDVSPKNVDIDVNANWLGSRFLFDDDDFAMMNQEIVPEKLRECVRGLANQIEIKTLQEIRDNVGGIYGTTSAPDDQTDITKTLLRLNNQKAPLQDRSFIVTPATYAEFLETTALSGADTTGQANPALISGFLGNLYGASFYMSQNLTDSTMSVTSGTVGTNATGSNNQADVNGALAKGAESMAVDGAGLASGTIKKGQKFKFAGLDQEFSVTADVTLSSNAGTVSFSPMLDTAIADDTQVTFYKTFSMDGVAITPDVATIVYLDFEPIDPRLGAVVSQEQDPMTGARMRLIKTWENYQTSYSLQVCFGVGVVRAECGAILGTFSGTGTAPA